MAIMISIRPIDGGWAVTVDGVENPMIFRTGSAAEAAARRLAVRLGDVGAPAQIRLFLNDGGLTARLIYAPDLKPKLAWAGKAGVPSAA